MHYNKYKTFNARNGEVLKDNDQEITFKTLILASLDALSFEGDKQRALTVSELMERLKISKKFDGVGGDIEFSVEEVNVLKKLVAIALAPLPAMLVFDYLENPESEDIKTE